MLICFFSGFIVGRLAVRRQLGFLVGVIIGVIIYLGGFITRYIPGYPGNLNSTSSGPNAGATIGAIGLLLIFLMFWSVLVIIGSFFRGQGFNFTFPWNDHVFFEL